MKLAAPKGRPTELPSRLREGPGEGLLRSIAQQALPQPLP